MKNLIRVVSLSLLIISCSSNDDEVNQSVIDVGIDFSLLNQEGEDMLNSETANYFSEMQLYYLINGEKIKVQDYNPQIGDHNGTMLITESSPYRLRCFTYCCGYEGITSDEDGIKRGVSIAYLELNKEVTDTIKTEWELKEGKYFVNRKVWYNGELKSVEEPFTVIK